MAPDGIWPVAAVPAIAALALAKEAVDLRGALAGALVGGGMALGLGWAGVAVLAALLVLGTLCSPASGRRRDWCQVASNGGAAALAALASGCGLVWGAAASTGALAAALSDTLSGELGKRFGGVPRALLVGPRVVRGADGGMTPFGTGAGIVAAAIVPFLALLLDALPDAATALRVAAAGMGGNLADSLFGLFVQPRLGARGNDWCNVVATCAGALLGALAV
ncbi:MAG: DUF92 domain-containing protein [Planctomycetaceae bacterium]